MFLILIAASVLAAYPVVSSVNRALRGRLQKALDDIEQKTHLSVRYDRLSPAILYGISIKGLTFSEAGSGSALLKVDRVTLRYSALSIIRGNANDAAMSLTMNGVDIDVDKQRDEAVLQALSSLREGVIASGRAKTRERSNLSENTSKRSMADNAAVSRVLTLQKMPSISLRNVNLRYKDGETLCDVLFSRVNARRTKESIRIRASGDTSLSSGSAYLSTAFNSTAAIRPSLGGSTVLFRLRNVAAGRQGAGAKIAMRQVNILTSYDGEVITAETIQTPLPLKAKAQMNTKNMTLSARVQTASLPLTSIFSLDKSGGGLHRGTLAAALDTVLTADTEASFAFDEQQGSTPSRGYGASASFIACEPRRRLRSNQSVDTERHPPKKGHAIKDLSYHSSGSVILPRKRKASSSTQVQYALIGDGKMVRLSSFKAWGRSCDVSGALSYTFSQKCLAGRLDARRITLPSGMNTAGTFTFAPLESGEAGFSAMSPEVAIADGAISAFEASVMPKKAAVDFAMKAAVPKEASLDTDTEFATQTSPDTDTAGGISVSGNYSAADGGAVASVTVSQCYLDSICAILGVPLSVSARSMLSRFMFAGEGYISADKNSFTYNVPYALAMNTQKDNEAVYLSLEGNTESVSVSQLDIVLGARSANLTVHLERAQDGGAFFTLDALLSDGGTSLTTVPYRFSGSVSGTPLERFISVSDEYGSLFQASLLPDEVQGNLVMTNFPLTLGGSLFSLSTEAGFAWNKTDGVAVNIGRFEAEGMRQTGGVPPRFAMRGEITKYGAFFDKMSYTDAYSALDGSAHAFLNLSPDEEAQFDSAKLDFSLTSPVSSEAVTLDCEVTNPDGLALTVENIKDGLYFNVAASCASFALSRFVREKSENNTLSAAFDAIGTLSNPYVNLSVSRASLMFASNPIIASGNASIIDKVLNVADWNVQYGKASINDIAADFSLETFTGGSTARLSVKGRNAPSVVTAAPPPAFSMPISVAMLDTELSPATGLPASFTVDITAGGVQETQPPQDNSPQKTSRGLYRQGGTVRPPVQSLQGDILQKTSGGPHRKGERLPRHSPLKITVMRSPGETAVFSSDNLGISGYFVDGGEMNVMSTNDILGFCISGKNDFENLDFTISDLNIDAAAIVSRFKNEKFAMYNGILTGDLYVGGIRSDPDFRGVLTVEKPDFSLLKVVPYHITGDAIVMTAEHSQIDIPEVALLDNGPSSKNAAEVFVSGKIMFDRWMFDNMELFVRTPEGGTAPALLDVPVAAFEGDASIDLVIGIDRNKTLDVSGSVYVENTLADVHAKEVMNLEGSLHNEIFSRRVNIDVTMGPHVSVALDPLLRALLSVGSTVNFQMDEDADSFSLVGDVGIKSGDIAYLGRSFYLKDGTISINADESDFDPVITLKAETRDRDDDGKDVKIIMTANKQRLSTFSPRFSSIPVKSEAEIRAMLGSLAIGGGESASDVMLSMGDFAVTATVGRALENTIRDIFKFDIFSIRTDVLQNLLKNSINPAGAPLSDQGDGGITAGNLLDNSTVYIGKYIGSVVYLDAMLHLSYDEHKKDELGTKNGISFQPEIGFELDAPFAGIRWSMAPNIDAMKENIFMPTTSVTLSWGFSF